MAEERIQRRLAAILAADVVGFSRLMEADESGTLMALKSRRKDVLEPLVARHQGRVFKVTGDGVLVEFGSAVNALQCAVDLQQAMAAANGNQPNDCHIILRIGVNLGDVLVEGSDLYGDGVNIAARLESIAEPGGILVSGTAYDHIKSKVKVGFDDLGAQTLKNIAEPVRAYRVAGTPRVSVATPKAASGKPSIAVLPFINMSGDPEQEYFSDGITEDVIIELSRFRELCVVARNSSFQYREQHADARRIGSDLGVGYVVEGSVRKVTDRIRVTAQLIDAITGNHLWAERFDRHLDDIFSVQDEVVRTIVATLAGRIAASGAERVRRKPPQLWAAYECFLQGREHVHRFDPDTAESLLQRAIGLDPDFAQAHSELSRSYVTKFYQTGRLEILGQALACAQRALLLDKGNGECHRAMGTIYLFQSQFDLAGVYFENAIALSPNDAQITTAYANWLARMGRTQEALKQLDDAARRDPFLPDWYWEIRSVPLLQEKRYEEVIDAVHRIGRLQAWNHYTIAIAYAYLGRNQDAMAHAAEVLRLKPDYSACWVKVQEPYRNPADLVHMLEGLRKAGLPE